MSMFCRLSNVHCVSAALVLAAIAPFMLAGCSSGTSSAPPQVGAIAFTDANATTGLKPLTSLTVSHGTYLDVGLTNDAKMLGADWTAICGSALPPGTPLPPGQTQDQSCGAFTPGHTLSTPLPGYATGGAGYVTFYTAPAVPPKQGIVTLYASSTSDPSRFSTVTLSITGLPISVGFAPPPPLTLGLSTSTQIKAVLNNDATNAGVTWSVLCPSAACGSFSSAQTASGVLNTYTTPATAPSGGIVQVTATSIADPTKTFNANIQIQPIGVSVSPAILSVPTAGIGSITATVANDGLSKGVDWTVGCTNTTAPGNCGSITSHTASGAVATYVAPTLANIAVGASIVLTASSTTDPSKTATSTVTTIKGSVVRGTVQAAERPVANAEVSLRAAATAELAKLALPFAASANDASAVTTATTDPNGNFSIPAGYVCPAPDAQMYLVSTGGNAGGGLNPNLTLITALGPCSQLEGSVAVIDEVTTVASVYALSGFMTDAEHVGSGNTSTAGLATAFLTANDLADMTTGVVRSRTVSGAGIVPQDKINSLANLLSACAETEGASSTGNGSRCDEFFRATNSSTSPAAQPNDTIRALLNVAHRATESGNTRGSMAPLVSLAAASPILQPALSAEPEDWTLAIQFPTGQEVAGGALSAASLQRSIVPFGAGSFTDAAGNVWLRGGGESVLEFVGAASCTGAPNTLIPIAAASRAP